MLIVCLLLIVNYVGSGLKKKYLNKNKIFSFYLKSFFNVYGTGVTPNWFTLPKDELRQNRFRPYRKYRKIFYYYLTYVSNYAKNNAINFQNKLVLGQIKCNAKQYFFSTLGVNFKFFQTVSMGKLLKRLDITAKFAKKSKKFNKIMLDYYETLSNKPKTRFSYYFLKPINVRNLNLWYMLYEKYKPKSFQLGGAAHYKIVTKKAARIKKKIKKKILASSSFYSV